MTREEVEAGIYEAFRGVGRENGISWTESVLIDQWVVDSKQLHDARMSDRDTDWTDLVEDENWDCDILVGGFSFLDPIGFRYYLAAAMIRALRGDVGWNLGYSLEPGEDERSREYKQYQWSALTGRQQHAVAEFARFMAEIEAEEEYPVDVDGFGRAWRHHWERVLQKSVEELDPVAAAVEVRKGKKRKRRRGPSQVLPEVLGEFGKEE